MKIEYLSDLIKVNIIQYNIKIVNNVKIKILKVTINIFCRNHCV